MCLEKSLIETEAVNMDLVEPIVWSKDLSLLKSHLCSTGFLYGHCQQQQVMQFSFQKIFLPEVLRLTLIPHGLLKNHSCFTWGC